jgi:hypothetical protein
VKTGYTLESVTTRCGTASQPVLLVWLLHLVSLDQMYECFKSTQYYLAYGGKENPDKWCQPTGLNVFLGGTGPFVS